MRVYTVADLISQLQLLPPDTEIWSMRYSGTYPLNEESDDPFLVCEQSGRVRLFVDDGEAFHGDEDKASSPLFSSGDAWDRIRDLSQKNCDHEWVWVGRSGDPAEPPEHVCLCNNCGIEKE